MAITEDGAHTADEQPEQTDEDCDDREDERGDREAEEGLVGAGGFCAHYFGGRFLAD